MNFVKFTSTIKERRLKMLETGHLADCEFIVGLDCAQSDDSDNDSQSDREEGDANSRASSPASTTDDSAATNDNQRRFRCHKMILASASEVFECMFYGELAEQPGSTIYVSDVTPQSFEIFLKYVYSYELDISAELLQQACYLLNLGHKYMMQDFTDVCVKALVGRPWLFREIFPMFDLACLYENMVLMLSCYERIQKNAALLLNHHTFYELNVNYLKRLVVLLSSHPVKMLSSALLGALERFCLRKDYERDSVGFNTLREAASVLDIRTLSYERYSNSFLYPFVSNASS